MQEDEKEFVGKKIVAHVLNVGVNCEPSRFVAVSEYWF